jgi:hypothetical protein
MNNREYFNSIDIQEIDRFVSEQQEENINIEFKTVNHPSHNSSNRDYDRNNLSKVISGFANSNGGIVIWGIKASLNEKGQDVAKELKPIMELTKFLNFLNRSEGQVVIPTVIGIEHTKIETSYDEGFIKTYIPASDNAPHMALNGDKHYYKRSGDSFSICEHYDIMDMLNRKTTPTLEVMILDRTDGGIGAGKKQYSKVIAIKNTSRSIAKFPYLKMEVNPPFYMAEYGLDGNGKIGLFNHKSIPSGNYHSTYSGGQDIVIHPGIIYEIDRIKYETPATDSRDIPTLVVKYLIAAENMESINGELRVFIEPWD